jgi:hypothetical protein
MAVFHTETTWGVKSLLVGLGLGRMVALGGGADGLDVMVAEGAGVSLGGATLAVNTSVGVEEGKAPAVSVTGIV